MVCLVVEVWVCVVGCLMKFRRRIVNRMVVCLRFVLVVLEECWFIVCFLVMCVFGF